MSADRIDSLRRSYEADPENEVLGLRLEAALRQAGRDAEADSVVIPTQIQDARNAREYVLGSNGKLPKRSRFTVTHSGQRITFSTQRERLAEDRDYNPETDESDSRFWKISAMVGSDNDQSYVDFGVVYLQEHGYPVFRWASESTIAKSDKVVQVFAWLWDALSKGYMPADTAFYNEGRCVRCRRVLTVPESRSRGQGPVCAHKYGSKERPIQPSSRLSLSA